MRIRAYILFPDTDDDFLRIGNNPQSYIDLIDEVGIIKQQLRQHKEFDLCFDSTNVDSFLTKAEILIGGQYLADCRQQIRILFGNHSQNVSNTTLRKNDCNYAHWNISQVIVNARAIVSEAAESKHSEGEHRTIIINIADAYATTREAIHVIKDATHYNELPLLISIPVSNNEQEFSQWHTTLSNPQFALTDKTRFTVTPHKWNKQKIYQEKTTGNYWYYDYFHNENRKHFEVFSSAGIHLGEANTSGVLDTSKADNQKRIDQIIQ